MFTLSCINKIQMIFLPPFQPGRQCGISRSMCSLDTQKYPFHIYLTPGLARPRIVVQPSLAQHSYPFYSIHYPRPGFSIAAQSILGWPECTSQMLSTIIGQVQYSHPTYPWIGQLVPVRYNTCYSVQTPAIHSSLLGPDPTLLLAQGRLCWLLQVLLSSYSRGLVAFGQHFLWQFCFLVLIQIFGNKFDFWQ